MAMMNPKFIKTTSLSNLNATLDSNEGDCNLKVLNITNCATADVERLLYDKNFRELLENHKTLFALVIQYEEDDSKSQGWEFSQETFVTQKPLVLSLESSKGSIVFYKESIDINLKKISLSRGKEKFEEFFDFETFFLALTEGIGDGSLLNCQVDVRKKIDGLRFIEHAAYNNNVLCIRFLRLFDWELDFADNEKLLDIAAKSCDQNGFSAILDLPFDCETSVMMNALQLINHKKLNLLLIASESGNVEAVNFLLKCSYINQQRDLNESAACVAWRNQNFQVFVKLLKENSLFPNDFNEKLKQMKERGKVKSVLTYISDLNSLHENIKRGRIDQIKGFLSRNPSTRHAYNVKNESAASVALKSGQFGIYEFFISQGVCLGPHEDIDEVLSETEATKCHDDRRTMMKKIYLHEIHKKYLKTPFEKHLMILLSHSDIGFDTLDEEKRNFFKHIKEAFELLNEIEEISWILKIVAKSKFFKIVFDFNRYSVNFIDPTSCKETKGTSYFKSGYIYIGAKGLLDETLKFEVLGTLSHELCHYALHLIYENNCNPYRVGDHVTTREFSTILLLCEFNKAMEDKIFYVFKYPEAQRHAELIVRVPHLLAVYRNNPEQLEKCIKIFPELFEFFRSKVLRDFCQDYPLMLVKQETIELNNWLGVIQPLINVNLKLKSENLRIDLDAKNCVLLLVSNCVKLTVKAIHQQLQRDSKTNVESSVIFARIKSLENEKLKGLIVKALNLSSKPTIVFECEANDAVDDVKNVLQSLKVQERMIFVVRDETFDCKEFRKVEVKHAWEDFPAETQEILWKFCVNFQGHEVMLRDLMLIPSQAFDDIPFCDLLGQRLRISTPLNIQEIEFFIDRKFVLQNKDFDFLQLLDFVAESKLILLSDDPGNGKTTTFKMLTMKLKESFPSSWVVFLDLKKFIEVFEKHETVESTEVSQFFGAKILNLEKFELELFLQLFKNDRVIFLLDGIDEICPNFKKFIVDLIKSVRATSQNQLWISTRCHLTEEVCEALKPVQFHLKPFTKDEQRSFYLKFYENRDVSPCEIESYVENIEKVMNFLSKNRLFWSTINSDITSNPLFMRICAEIYDDDVMRKTQNGKCLTLCNLYLMYEKFIEKKFNLWMNKGRLSITDQIEIHKGSKSIAHFHIKIALQRIFNDPKVETLLDDPNLTNEQIIRVGLVTENGRELQFIHRSFAEFFVADFLFKRIFCSEVLTKRKNRRFIMRLFVRVLSSDEFQMIRAFLGNAFELVKYEKDVKKFAKNAKLFKKASRRNERDRVLKVTVGDGCVNLTSILLEFSLLNRNSIKKILHSQNRELENVLVNAIRIHRDNVDTIKTLWEVSKSIFPNKDVKNFLLKKNFLGKTLLHIAAYSDGSEVLEFLIGEVKEAASREEFEIFLNAKDNEGQDAFDIAQKYNTRNDSVKYLWKIYEKG